MCHIRNKEELSPELEAVPKIRWHRAWEDWGVDVPLVLLDGDEGDVAMPIADYIEGRLRQREVLVVLRERRCNGSWALGLSNGSAERIAQRLTDCRG